MSPRRLSAERSAAIEAGKRKPPPIGLCGDQYPVPDRHEPYPCTLVAGHKPAQLHEHHHSTHPASWPPVKRWWRCEDGSVIGR